MKIVLTLMLVSCGGASASLKVYLPDSASASDAAIDEGVDAEPDLNGADLSQSADLRPHPDDLLLPTCGTLGMTCCAGSTCSDGYSYCDGTSTCAPCGQFGQVCCPGNACPTSGVCMYSTTNTPAWECVGTKNSVGQACGSEGLSCCAAVVNGNDSALSYCRDGYSCSTANGVAICHFTN